jgi:UDP-3-O-[3-hydroxymyristoyl] glucosamine N-acyltransferase
MMLLSTIAASIDAAVFRDGEFETLGFVSRQRSAMLVFAESARFVRAAGANPRVAAVLTTPELARECPEIQAVGTCARPKVAFARLHNHLAESGFYWTDFPTEISPEARVHPSAVVASRNVRIGAGVEIGPHATVAERCTLGRGVAVGPGVVLGGVGFQTVRATEGWVEFTHAGGLLIEDGVRLLAGAVVATGLFGESTRLGAEARIGTHAFVSHAVDVGPRTFIGHGAVVNGNVTIGAESWIGPGAVLANDLNIGAGAFISLGAVVIRDVAPGARLSGNFAVDHRRLLRSMAKLDED